MTVWAISWSYRDGSGHGTFNRVFEDYALAEWLLLTFRELETARQFEITEAEVFLARK